ncbi:uncharacterized protein [Eurosta solidaginis]|uniref:uncharacterized protein isoform X2 n=1 Tax=Eurosta solidaginis TaxID=178769 RepID=UPI0035309927
MAKEFVTKINTITLNTCEAIKKKLAIKKNIKVLKIIITIKTMANLGNIHNIRVVRFLLVVSIATLTIFIYATYSSNGPLTPPPQAHALLRSISDDGGGDGKMPQLEAANKRSDTSLKALGVNNNFDSSGLEISNNNHLDWVAAAAPQGVSEASLLKMNRNAAVIPETSAGGSGGSGLTNGAGSAAKSLSTNIVAKKQHQHREPTIDVDTVIEETGDDDDMERFGNDLLEDGGAQNIDNVLVGSINNSNTSSAQQNNGGLPQEQSRTSQGHLDQQMKANEKSIDNTNNADKILDTDVMIPTTNLQKFIENADKILKNITTTNEESSKILSRINVASAKDSTVNKEQRSEEKVNSDGNSGKDGDGVAEYTNNDDTLPPSVVMTIKRPGSNVQQTQHEPHKQKTPIKPTENHAVAKPKTPIINHLTTSQNQSDHTKGIALKEFYETGHLSEEINFAKVCPKNGEELKLLILITSAPNHGEARLAIRQTWAHYGTRRDVSIAFVLGRTENQSIYKELSIENFIYGDMIRGNFIDSYSNLTLKTVSTLEWVDAHCRQAKFILKTDDDMFINVPKLLQFIDGHAKQKRVIYGRLAKQWKPIRNKKSKYYVSTEQFSQPIFPAFTTGPAYLLTSDVVHSLYERALQQVYLKLEDVFTTGIVAQQLGIKRVHANEFLNRRIAFNPCNIRKLISVHMIKSNEQFDLWKKLLDKSTKCK